MHAAPGATQRGHLSRPPLWQRAGAAGICLGAALGLFEAFVLRVSKPTGSVVLDVQLAGILVYSIMFASIGGLLGAVYSLGRRLLRNSSLRSPSDVAAWCFPVFLYFPLAALILSFHADLPVGVAGGLVLSGLVAGGAVVRLLGRQPFLMRRVFSVLALLMVAGQILYVALPANPRVSPVDTTRRAAAAQTDGKLNVVLITIDSLRGDSVGFCGNRAVKTPNLDELAASSFRSCSVITPQPATNAAHASLLTGMSPNEHGIRTHMVDHLGSSAVTLAETLNERGYSTAAIYSWVSLMPGFSGLNRGFEYYEGFFIEMPAMLENSWLQAGAGFYRRLKEYLTVFRASEMVMNLGDTMEEKVDARADITADAALKWLGQRDQRPFFLWVHLWDPHYPYLPPPPYDKLIDPDYQGSLDGNIRQIWGIENGSYPLSAADKTHLIALYQGEISFADEQLGRMIGYLKEAGIWDSTILVVVGDHGESLGEHGTWFHPSSLYQQQIAVPLVLRWPGMNPGRADDYSISSIDFAPTLLDLLGQTPPATMSGRTFLGSVRGEPDHATRTVFSQRPDDSQTAVLQGRWKLIATPKTGYLELYDLLSDPDENSNVAEAYPGMRESLTNLLVAWMERQSISPGNIAPPR